MSDKMLEALKLADAALSGANMNMTVVMRKIREALAEQLVNGEAVVEADVQRVIDRLMSSDPDFEDCEEAANMLRQLATATPAPAFDVVIAGDELAALHEWTAPDNEAGVRLFVAQGGLHMVCADYPDEGSVHLADVAAPPAPAVPDGWRDAFIAVCGAWDGCDRFVSANFARLGDAVVEYPVLQGTSNQLAVRRVGRLAYDGKRAASALRQIAEMLAAAPEVKS